MRIFFPFVNLKDVRWVFDHIHQKNFLSKLIWTCQFWLISISISWLFRGWKPIRKVARSRYKPAAASSPKRSYRYQIPAHGDLTSGFVRREIEAEGVGERRSWDLSDRLVFLVSIPYRVPYTYSSRNLTNFSSDFAHAQWSLPFWGVPNDGSVRARTMPYVPDFFVFCPCRGIPLGSSDGTG